MRFYLPILALVTHEGMSMDLFGSVKMTFQKLRHGQNADARHVSNVAPREGSHSVFHGVTMLSIEKAVESMADPWFPEYVRKVVKTPAVRSKFDMIERHRVLAAEWAFTYRNLIVTALEKAPQLQQILQSIDYALTSQAAQDDERYLSTLASLKESLETREQAAEDAVQKLETFYRVIKQLFKNSVDDGTFRGSDSPAAMTAVGLANNNLRNLNHALQRQSRD